MTEKILVVRLGALGDLVLCFQAFHEIRQAHPGVEIALLTTKPFADFARHMPWFDRIMIDPHPKAREVGAWLGLVRQIRDFGPTRVYDLQGKFRQSILYGLLGGPLGPKWSGAAPLCAFPRHWPPDPTMHFKDFLAAQLRLAHVPAQEPRDLAWLNAPVEGFALPSSYVVLIGGCTPGQTYKRWPGAYYGALAREIQAKGLAVVAVGTKQDADAIAEIKATAPDIIDLGGKTSLFELAGILRGARAVVGNDTGPMHMAAELGTPTLALLSGRTNPVWSAPRGLRNGWCRHQLLSDLGVAEVSVALTDMIDRNT